MNARRMMTLALVAVTGAAAAQWSLPAKAVATLYANRKKPRIQVGLSTQPAGFAGVQWSNGEVFLYREKPFSVASPHSQTAPNSRTGIDLHLQYAPAKNRIDIRLAATDERFPSREALPPDFDFIAPGYGYLGLNDVFSGLPTAEAAGENIRMTQRQGSLNWTGSVGQRQRPIGYEFSLNAKSERLTHRNPFTDLNQFSDADFRFAPDGDGPIDFSPDYNRTPRSAFGSLTTSVRDIQLALRATLASTGINLGLTPGSQRALNGLAALDPRFVGNGRFLWDDLAQTIPTLDGLGNQVYALDPGAVAPRLTDTGSTRQISLSASRDFYFGDNDLVQVNLVGNAVGGYGQSRPYLTGGIFWTHALPEDDNTLGLSWTRVTEVPPVTTGIFLGDDPRPSISDHMFLTLTTRAAQLVVYAVHEQNPFELTPLIPGTRLLIPRLAQYDRGIRRGFAVNFFPVTVAKNTKLQAMWKNEVARPYSFGPAGVLYPEYYANQALNTVSVNLTHNSPVGTWLLTLNHSSGAFSTDLFRDGNRSTSDVMDLEWNRGAWKAGIRNLLDDRKLLQFFDLGGAGYQQGRTFWVQYTVN